MARPKIDHGDSFSFGELALAAEISKEAFRALDKNGLLPGDRGIRDFKRLAVVGGFLSGGFSLFTAARLAKTVITMEFNGADGEATGGFDDLILEHRVELQSSRPANDYWAHRALLENGIFTGRAHKNDVHIEIIDARYVICRYRLSVVDPVLRTEGAYFVGWLGRTGHGIVDVEFTHRANTLGWDEDDPQAREMGRALGVEVHEAVQNPVSVLKINISLAIRKALDRLAEHRTKAASRAKVAA